MTDHTTHFDDCGCKTAALNDAARINAELRRDLTAARDNSSNMAVEVGALRAERDALRLRVAALEAAIAKARIQLDCPPQDMLDAAAALLNAHKMLAGDTTALREMLVEAAQLGFKDGRDYEALSTEAALSWPKHDVWCDAICDRILGASKGGGE